MYKVKSYFKNKLATLCWRYLSSLSKNNHYDSGRLLTMWPNERNALVIYDNSGKQLFGINGIEVSQGLHMMKAGIANVKLSMIVKIKPPAPKLRKLSLDEIEKLMRNK